jgi:hypothetical protein
MHTELIISSNSSKNDARQCPEPLARIAGTSERVVDSFSRFHFSSSNDYVETQHVMLEVIDILVFRAVFTNVRGPQRIGAILCHR